MRKEKQLLLDEIVENLDKASSIVLMRYQNLDADLNFSFRSKLSKSGGKIYAFKKRVFLKAIAEKTMEFSKDELPGHVAAVLGGDDPIAAAKVVCDFKKEFNQDSLEILGGFFEGAQISKGDVLEIAKLPGKDEMRAQLLGLFEAPMALSLGAMDAVMSSVPSCLMQKSEKEE
ncbi:MAG: 50S ribosomal protein L10 [Candidatus Algichlamydia australiensis]|nr:50S ribosomal protein L10 [Chlamydiales bacterium]